VFIILYHSDLEMERKSYTCGANFQLKSHHFTQASFFLNLAQESFTDFGNYGYILPLISFDKCILRVLRYKWPWTRRQDDGAVG